MFDQKKLHERKKKLPWEDREADSIQQVVRFIVCINTLLNQRWHKKGPGRNFHNYNKSKDIVAFYQNILKLFMLPSADKLFVDVDFIVPPFPQVPSSGLLTIASLRLKFAWPKRHRESVKYCQLHRQYLSI